MKIERNGYKYDDSDLNSTLQYCAYLRGTGLTIHRTLREFEWFVSTIFDYCDAAYELEVQEIRKNAKQLNYWMVEMELSCAAERKEIAKKYAYLIDEETRPDSLLSYAKGFAEYCEQRYVTEADE